MEHPELILRFGIARLVGVLIGLACEYAHLREKFRALAGVLTFPLIALLGCSLAHVTNVIGGWAIGITSENPQKTRKKPQLIPQIA